MSQLKTMLIAFTSLALTSSAAFALDNTGRESLLKDSKCFKCHAVDKRKLGPSFKETAAKYRGKANAERKVYAVITTGPKINGVGERHVKINSTNNGDIKTVVAWILAL